ncbi:hypothetical protein [Streptosporangium sp. NPDC002524]|uniref:hypothetical protein n=1 Tax=Streptosporangium sp. NPDC002524 TaxID=3154537 RepID=UPI0033309DF3
MTAPATYGSAAVDAAERLREALAGYEIVADVHDGYGLALVSVGVGLVVWSNGERFWWHTGWNAERRRAVYAWQEAAEPGRAARRIAFHHAGLCETTPPAPDTASPL